MNKDETLALYRQGKDAWNAWAKDMLERRAEMEKAKTWAVDARGGPNNIQTRDWCESVKANLAGHVFEEEADFRGFCFPGKAIFRKSEFKKDAWFQGAAFDGNAWFRRTMFSGNVKFGGATFGGVAEFARATFVRDARFRGAHFKRRARFSSAKFGGNASFALARFDNRAHFVEVKFGGYAWFGGAMFSRDAGFERATFSGKSEFNGATFKDFTSFTKAEFQKSAIFAGAHSHRTFTLERASFEEVPDFIQAHFEEAPRLDHVSIPKVGGILRCLFPNLPGVEAGAETSARYRALKRLAIEAHDHTGEQDYFASELKALRGNPDRLAPCPLNLVRKDEKGKRLPIWPGGPRGTVRYWMGLFYEVLSNFGRSMVLPLFWLLVSAAGFAWTYFCFRGTYPAAGCLAGPGDALCKAIGLSVRKALPFAGVASGNKLDQIYACLYGITGSIASGAPLPERFTPVIPDIVDYLGIFQILLSLILIFLILLAVRNHFRIR